MSNEAILREALETILDGLDSTEYGYHLANAALAATAAPEQRDDKDAEYEIIQDDMQVAATSGPDAYREIMHYAAQYEQDGPLEIFKVVRTAVAATKGETK